MIIGLISQNGYGAQMLSGSTDYQTLAQANNLS
jgi:hypothetical protein